MIVVSSGELVVTLDETLGGEIRQITYGGDPLLAFYEWPAPVPAARSRSYGDPKLDWLSEYRGGWQLLIPNAGAACTVDDVPLPFHGEWSRTLVDVVAAAPAEVTFRAGARLPFVVERTIRILGGPARLAVTTTIENLVDRALPFVWGEHPAFLTAPGDRVDLPAGPVHYGESPAHAVAWPESPVGGTLDEIPSGSIQGVHFLPDRPAGWAALRRPHVGVALRWEVADFAHAWLWHEVGGDEFPFFGRTSLVAIEPSSSWPGEGLAAAVERGQAHWLDPHERRTTSVTVVPFRPDGRAVTGVEHDGTIRFREDPA